MADLTITAANVVPTGDFTEDRSGLAGATITAGQVVYKDSTTKKMKLSDADGTGTKSVDGIALNGASDGQPLATIKSGDVTIGATMTAGLPYFLSATAGGICPEADVATGMRKIQIGIAKSTTVLHVAIIDTGVTV